MTARNQKRSTSSERWFTKPMQLQPEGRTGRRRSLGPRPSAAARTCSRWRFSAPRSTCYSAEGSDDMTDAPPDLSNALLTILLGRPGSTAFDGVRPPIAPRYGSDHDACRAGAASRRSHLCSWAMARRSQRSRAEGRLGTYSALSRQPATLRSGPRLRMDDEPAGRQRPGSRRVEVRQRRSSRRAATRGLSASAAGLDKTMRS